MTFEQLELFERWKPILGFEGLYEVSNWGRIRSLAKPNMPGQLMKQQLKKRGYLTVSLSKENKRSNPFVHKLVAEAFIGQRPTGKQIDHIDGDKRNNILPNLHYVTAKQNREAGNFPPQRIYYGDANPATKLTEAQLIEARRLRLEGMKYQQIADYFRVSIGCIYMRLNGRPFRKDRHSPR